MHALFASLALVSPHPTAPHRTPPHPAPDCFAVSPTAISGSHTGQAAFLTMEAAGHITRLKDTPGMTRVLTEEQVKALAEFPESDVVRALTPEINRVLGLSGATGLLTHVFINSEKPKWLQHHSMLMPQNMLKEPDGFIACRAFVRMSGGCAGQGTGEEFYFGPLAHYRLQYAGCVTQIFEGKRGVGDLKRAEFGDVIDYCAYINRECKALLFNARQFYLYHANGKAHLSLTIGDWTMRGAAEAIKAFFGDQEAALPDLALLLRELLSILPCELAPTRVPGGESCFLGAGANGFVFQVRRVAAAATGAAAAAGAAAVEGSAAASAAPVTGGAGTATAPSQLLALKVILAPPRSVRALDAAQEYAALQMAAELGAPVVAPVRGSLRALPLGVGFMMSEVGNPAPCTSSEQCYAAFTALQRLHWCGVVHGDARLQNLLSVVRAGKKQLVWVDLRTSVVLHHSPQAFVAYAFEDAVILAASIIGCEDTVLPTHIAASIRTYKQDMPDDALRAMSDAVFGAEAHDTVPAVREEE